MRKCLWKHRLLTAKLGKVDPKIHTIRKDEKDRWEAGNKIHFVVKNRTKERLQFAPVLAVKSVQHIEIKHLSITKEPIEIKPMVWIDGYLFYDPAMGINKGMDDLARNDGFESVKDFFKYFNSDFKGKIIHWTYARY